MATSSNPNISRRGDVHITLADTFLKSFPLETIVTLKELDFWGFAQKEYGSINPNSSQELNDARGNMRKRINSGATAGSRPPESRFFVAVKTHGKDYVVQKGHEQLKKNVDAFPGHMRSSFSVKRGHIRNLISSTDYALLNPTQKLQVDMLDTNLDRTERLITSAVNEFKADWRRTARALEEVRGRAANGGLLGFLDSEDDDDEEAAPAHASPSFVSPFREVINAIDKSIKDAGGSIPPKELSRLQTIRDEAELSEAKAIAGEGYLERRVDEIVEASDAGEES